MIGVLRKNNYQIGDEAEPHFIQEMYDMHLLVDKRHQHLSDAITFPKYSSKSLIQSNSVLGENILSFELIDGGRFISDRKKCSRLINT